MPVPTSQRDSRRQAAGNMGRESQAAFLTDHDTQQTLLDTLLRAQEEPVSGFPGHPRRMILLAEGVLELRSPASMLGPWGAHVPSQGGTVGGACVIYADYQYSFPRLAVKKYSLRGGINMNVQVGLVAILEAFSLAVDMIVMAPPKASDPVLFTVRSSSLAALECIAHDHCENQPEVRILLNAIRRAADQIKLLGRFCSFELNLPMHQRGFNVAMTTAAGAMVFDYLLDQSSRLKLKYTYAQLDVIALTPADEVERERLSSAADRVDWTMSTESTDGNVTGIHCPNPSRSSSPPWSVESGTIYEYWA